MDNLVPYFVENVRIRYYAFDKSHGYATGIDLKVNGEFVPGIESWVSLSFMSTQEDIYGDVYYDREGNIDESRGEPGFIPRPTDQRVNVSIFFQDYLPMNPTYKMSLTFLYGSSLPFGPPNSPKYQHTLRMPPYRRVDIGFMRSLVSNGKNLTEWEFFDRFKEANVSLEIFNVMDIDNISSYFFVADIYNNYHAVPNRLTGITFNLKLAAKF